MLTLREIFFLMEDDAGQSLMLFSSSTGAKHLVYSYLYFDEEYVIIIIFTLILYIYINIYNKEIFCYYFYMLVLFMHLSQSSHPFSLIAHSTLPLSL